MIAPSARSGCLDDVKSGPELGPDINKWDLLGKPLRMMATPMPGTGLLAAPRPLDQG